MELGGGGDFISGDEDFVEAVFRVEGADYGEVCEEVFTDLGLFGAVAFSDDEVEDEDAVGG